MRDLTTKVKPAAFLSIVTFRPDLLFSNQPISLADIHVNIHALLIKPTNLF